MSNLLNNQNEEVRPLNKMNSNYTPIEVMLNDMFSPDWLRITAEKVGLVKRQRKVDPVTLFWVLVLGFGVGVQRTLASLRRAYEKASAKSIVPSAFYDRFTPQLVEFLRECLAHGIAELSINASLALSDKLKGFQDLIIADGTIIKLHDNLAKQYPGARSKAELKIHTVIGATSSMKSIEIFSGKTAEVKTMRIGPWVKNNILLFDLGFFKYQMFSKITHNGGYFVSRLKQNANPLIVSVLRQHRGQAIDLAGMNLKDILPRLKREVLDVEVEISFKRRSYRGKQTLVTENYRLVGTLDDATKEYHLYLTNLTTEQFSAEDIALLYGARWSIELVFKELKRIYQLDVLSSGSAPVVEALVLVAMLTLVVSRRVLNHVRTLAQEKAMRMTPMRWAEVFQTTAFTLLGHVLKAAGIDDDPFTLMMYYMAEGIDPNVNRSRLMSPWVVQTNLQ
jgi:putative transposase